MDDGNKLIFDILSYLSPKKILPPAAKLWYVKNSCFFLKPRKLRVFFALASSTKDKLLTGNVGEARFLKIYSQNKNPKVCDKKSLIVQSVQNSGNLKPYIRIKTTANMTIFVKIDYIDSICKSLTLKVSKKRLDDKQKFVSSFKERIFLCRIQAFRRHARRNKQLILCNYGQNGLN